MKKIAIIWLFGAGILVGALSLNALSFFTVNNTHWPLVSTSMDIQQIIQNLTQSMQKKNLTITKDRYKRFEEVFSVLENGYYDQSKLNSGAMIKQAVKALVNAIEDPYTVYLDNEEYAWFQEDLKGTSDLEWIGAVVAKKDYYIMIEEVLKDSPAFKAWLRPLDRIIAVEQQSTKDETVNEAVLRIRWPKGTTVTLTIERPNFNDDTKEIFDVVVTRDKLTIPSVTNEILTLQWDKKVAHMTISMIGEETENILKKELLEIKEQNIQGIILDLRGNWWWILPISVQIASHFIPKNALVVSAKYQWYPDEVFNSLGYNDFSDMPVIVLIDSMTASAGEIIALALQEQIGATLIGTQTFGKWSIQTLYEFDDQDSLKYTIGKRYSPSGKNIDKEWVTPDIVIEFNPEQYTESQIDNQLEEAKKVMENKLQ